MKRCIAFFLLMNSFLLAQAQSGAPLTQFDVLHYKYSITVNNHNDTIFMEAQVRVKSLINHESFLFDLDHTEKRKGMRVLSVKDEAGVTQRMTHAKNQLRIFATGAKDEEKTFNISYRGIPANGLIIERNQFGTRTFFGDNWPNRAHHWLVCVDHPADKATIDWQVLAPPAYQVVANGIEKIRGLVKPRSTHRRWLFTETHPIPTKVAVVGIAILEKMTTSADSAIVPVINYVYPATGSKGLQKMSEAQNILTFFTNLLGPYPFDKLANVQSTTMFGGMENANTIFYDEKSIDGDRNVEALMAHEIAHQWFGNTVTEKDFSHIWLSEGFATFLTHYYLERRYGTDTLLKRLEKDRQKVKNFLATNQRPVVDATKDYMSLLNANSYEKGALFLQALRTRIGDDVFFSILRRYLDKFRYANADTSDFMTLVEEMTGRDWKAFFKEWLYSARLPEQ
jgi:aminopeptidase N